MLIPYRVKNPPKRFPVATVTIMALNVLIYALTVNSSLQIREDVFHRYAFEFGSTSFFNTFSAAFLHADIFHILGNMLFLWVFGPPVEDRLGIPKYLGLYFITGIVGFYLQAFMDLALGGSTIPGIGASGCIMGVMGAYWYLFSWSTVCVFYFFWIIRIYYGVWEVAAIWVIGAYMALNFVEGYFGSSAGGGGVANFAHVGGGIAGLLLCMAMRAKRDTQEVSDARAVHADAKDLNNMPLYALESMLTADPGNNELIRAMIIPSLRLGKQSVLDDAFKQAGPALIDKDPSLVSYYLTDFHGVAEIYQPVQLLHLAGMMERSGDPASAVNLYRLLVDKHPTSPEVETCLYRAALCSWNSYKDVQTSRSYLAELNRRFPNGDMIAYARNLWKQMG